jgi:hypothetical protein
MDRHHNTLCGLTNPFCEEAKNAKLPDTGAGSSFTEAIRWVGGLTADSNGDLAAQFIPRMDAPLLISSDMINWNGNTNWLQATNSLANTYAEKIRVTTYGIRIISLLSAVDAKGSVALATGAQSDPVTPVRFSPDYYAKYDLHGISAASEWHMIGKPTSSAATDMVEVTSDLYDNSGTPIPGWNNLFILCEGLPANTNCLRVEVVINFEYTIKTTTPLGKLQTPQPVFNPAMLTARNEVMNELHHVVKGGKASIEAHAKKEAKKALVKHVLPFLAKKGTKLAAGLLV